MSLKNTWFDYHNAFNSNDRLFFYQETWVKKI